MTALAVCLQGREAGTHAPTPQVGAASFLRTTERRLSARSPFITGVWRRSAIHPDQPAAAVDPTRSLRRTKRRSEIAHSAAIDARGFALVPATQANRVAAPTTDDEWLTNFQVVRAQPTHSTMTLCKDGRVLHPTRTHRPSSRGGMMPKSAAPDGAVGHHRQGTVSRDRASPRSCATLSSLRSQVQLGLPARGGQRERLQRIPHCKLVDRLEQDQ